MNKESSLVLCCVLGNQYEGGVTVLSCVAVFIPGLDNNLTSLVSVRLVNSGPSSAGQYEIR